MKFISRWLIKLADWLSKPDTVESHQSIKSQQDLEQELNHKALERLCGLLYSLLNTDRSFTPNMAMEQELLRLRLDAAKAQTIFHQKKLAPHLTYVPKVYNDGLQWVAKAEMPEGQPLVGRGDSPAEALNNYDMQWLGVE